MPSAKQVTMGEITPQQSREAALKLCIKRFKPYAVVSGELIDMKHHLWYVVFTAPRGGDREVIASRQKRTGAVRLRDQLSRAWAEGFAASSIS